MIIKVIISNIDWVDNFTQVIIVKIATDSFIKEKLELKNIVDEFSWTLETERKLHSFERKREVNL